MPGTNLPVCIRGVEFIVVNQDIEEVLSGRPFFKAIRFDLNKHLEEVSKKVNGKDIEELQDDRNKLLKAAFRGM